MPAQQGPLVSTLLRDEAVSWYPYSYEKWDPKTPLTREIHCAAMRDQFAPRNKDRRPQDEWANLRQQGTIFEYMSMFRALTMRIPGLTQTQIIGRFIRESKTKTGIEVELRDPKASIGRLSRSNRFFGVKSTSFLMQNHDSYLSTSNANGMNADYGEPMQIDALPRSRNFQRPHTKGLCFACSKPGHIAAKLRREAWEI